MTQANIEVYNDLIHAIGKTDEAINQEAISLIESTESEPNSEDKLSSDSSLKAPKKTKETRSRSNS